MGHTVLLVDDDENVLLGLVRVIRRQPYRILTARSAEEARWIFKVHPVDVIVTDEQMPHQRGTELLAWVAQHFPEVVRIVLTGQPTIDTAISAINQAAVFQFFTKPCNEVELALAIRRALELKDQQHCAAAPQRPPGAKTG